ncbi:50S ribosomal protein L5 [endosymbiont of Euscepes postfasciatus]|uniref:50S ribosomal protein L5 n=1 Tax=endosymbiont of Euscepes postfasciatus TaxID=650377 RepID=UPI000DC72582|nr:50S ribosomal protein L5 [endosymbiont of Euscepes postfasciatus]BBA84681.1 50S ribosomal protein L5 [endosymbiont of Euscepes postfasciatus]
MSILKLYKDYVINNMMEKFNYKSIMEVPYIYKITLNIGIGHLASDKNILNKYIKNISLISGQKPILTKSKKSISNFKIRENFVIGCKVTLRKYNMWLFIDRLIYITIPRIRDFKGLSIKSFDKFGNYNFGIKEQIVFTEVDYNESNNMKGLDICISIKSKKISESLELLKLLNFPLKIEN